MSTHFLPKVAPDSVSEMDPPLVLVVDDDATMRILLKAALEEEGYQVTVANSGEQGLSLYWNLSPAMVLLDAMMGTMNGFELCAQIRQHPLGQHIPILMLTVLDDQASIDQAFAAGATDFITKPIHWGVLSKRVKRLFEQVKVQHAHRRYAQESGRLQAWSTLLETLVVAQVQREPLLEVFEQLLPHIQAAFALETARLMRSPDSLATEEAKLSGQWVAVAKVGAVENRSGLWIAGFGRDATPWSEADAHRWDVLARGLSALV